MHNTGQKAQHWTQTKENNTQGALRRPREQESRGLRTTQNSRINCTEHSSEEKKKSQQSLRPETLGSMTTATVQLFSSFFLFMLHMYIYIFSIQICFLSKSIMPVIKTGSPSALRVSEEMESFSSIRYTSIRLKLGLRCRQIRTILVHDSR